jgi:hypothetical protein
MINQSTRVSSTQEKLAEIYGLLEEYERQPAVVIERVYAQKLKEIYNKLGGTIFVDENTPNIFIK